MENKFGMLVIAEMRMKPFGDHGIRIQKHNSIFGKRKIKNKKSLISQRPRSRRMRLRGSDRVRHRGVRETEQRENTYHVVLFMNSFFYSVQMVHVHICISSFSKMLLDALIELKAPAPNSLKQSCDK